MLNQVAVWLSWKDDPTQPLPMPVARANAFLAALDGKPRPADFRPYATTSPSGLATIDECGHIAPRWWHNKPRRGALMSADGAPQVDASHDPVAAAAVAKKTISTVTRSTPTRSTYLATASRLNATPRPAAMLTSPSPLQQYNSFSRRQPVWCPRTKRRPLASTDRVPTPGTRRPPLLSYRSRRRENIGDTGGTLMPDPLGAVHRRARAASNRYDGKASFFDDRTRIPPRRLAQSTSWHLSGVQPPVSPCQHDSCDGLPWQSFSTVAVPPRVSRPTEVRQLRPGEPPLRRGDGGHTPFVSAKQLLQRCQSRIASASHVVRLLFVVVDLTVPCDSPCLSLADCASGTHFPGHQSWCHPPAGHIPLEPSRVHHLSRFICVSAVLRPQSSSSLPRA